MNSERAQKIDKQQWKQRLTSFGTDCGNIDSSVRLFGSGIGNIVCRGSDVAHMMSFPSNQSVRILEERIRETDMNWNHECSEMNPATGIRNFGGRITMLRRRNPKHNRFVSYQTNRPTMAADRQETRMPARSIRPTCLEIASFFSLSTMPLKQPMTIPKVEKLAKEVMNTVSTAL